MAPSDVRDAPIEILGADDVEAALALSTEAGWNQVAADWRLMLRLGSGLCVRDAGTVVATALALPYAPAFGWVSMVLVHTPYRGGGLATRLVERATTALTGAGLVPVLDATPAGAEVYGRMGFRPVASLTRWRGTVADHDTGRQEQPLGGDEFALDREAFGADRTAVLAELATRPAPAAVVAPGGDGYLLSRAGRTATQLGPLVACDPATADSLLTEALARLSGSVVIDVPDQATGVIEHLVRNGFAPERPFRRMTLDGAAIPGDPALVHAIAGPELG